MPAGGRRRGGPTLCDTGRSAAQVTRKAAEKGLFQVGDEVAGVFQAHRQADRVVADTGARAFFLAQVAREIQLDRGDQRLRGTDARHRREQPQRVDEPPRPLAVAPEVEAQHAAVAVFHLFRGQFVSRVVLKARIVDPLDPRVPAQEFGQRHRALGVAPIAQRVGSQTAQDQEGRAGIQRRAHAGGQRLEFPEPLPVGDHDAAHDVAMTAGVLGQAVDVVVDPELSVVVQPPERVVQNGGHAMRPGQRRDRREIRNLHHRVGGRLENQALCVIGRENLLQAPQVVHAQQGMADSQAGQPLPHHDANRPIGLQKADDAVPGAQVAERRQPGGGHSRGYANRVIAALQLRRQLFQLPRGGIGAASVIEPLVAGFGRQRRGDVPVRELHRAVNGLDQRLVAPGHPDPRLMREACFLLHLPGSRSRALPPCRTRQ